MRTLMKIQRFDPSTMQDRAVTFIIGKRATGKTVLCADLLSRRRPPFDKGALVCPTIVTKGSECAPMFAPDRVHGNYDPQILRDVMAEQKQAIGEAAAAGQTLDKTSRVVLDDALYSIESVDKLREIVIYGRNLYIDLIVALPYPFGLPPTLRGSIDYVFILRENIISNRRRLYDNYAGMLPNFETFCDLLDKTTLDYDCLVIDNTVQSNKPEDCLFFYNANFVQGDDEPPPTAGWWSYVDMLYGWIPSRWLSTLFW